MLQKRLYNKVFKKLLKFFKQLLGRKIKGHFLSRIRTLTACITGMIRNKSSHLSDLGKGLLRLITAHSRMKTAKKFVYNTAVNYETYYLPYVKALIELLIPILPNKDTIELVIDGSQMGKYHAILMVSLVFGKRSIPIGWLVKKGAKGHFSKANHVALIEQVQRDIAEVLPNDRTIILLGDGEFGSIDLQQCCLAANWSYVFRTAFNTRLYKDGEEFQPKEIGVCQLEDYALIACDIVPPLEDLFPQTAEWEIPQDLQFVPNQDHVFVGQVEFSKQRFGEVQFVLWHDPNQQKAVPLVSNLTDARLIIQAYDRRWAVECLFKDLKSTSFKLDKTRLADAAAISNLVMIAAFAFTLLFKIGKTYQQHPIRAYIHQLRPDRVVYSTFNFALHLVGFLVEYDIDFCFDQVVPISIEDLKKRCKAQAFADETIAQLIG
ncbi:MAG: transposase [Saprospiraceae bacterium]